MDRLPVWAVGGLGLLIALVLQVTFMTSYVGALHDPQPHGVPIGVLDAGTATALRGGGDAFSPRLEPSETALRRAIRQRKIAAGLTGNRLFVASAASFTTASYLKTVFALQNPRLEVVELEPLPQGDSRGVTLFYAAIAWVFGGYFGATVITTLVGPRSPSHRGAAMRMGGLALFSLLAGLLGAVIVDTAFAAITGHFLTIAAVGALLTFAAAASTSALQSALGIAGTLFAMVAFVILGNSASGGAYQGTFTPGFWRAIGPWLPTGAGVSALRGCVYFGGANAGGRIAVLAAYAILGLAVTIVLGWRRVLRSPELELATAAGV